MVSVLGRHFLGKVDKYSSMSTWRLREARVCAVGLGFPSPLSDHIPYALCCLPSSPMSTGPAGLRCPWKPPKCIWTLSPEPHHQTCNLSTCDAFSYFWNESCHPHELSPGLRAGPVPPGELPWPAHPAVRALQLSSLSPTLHCYNST